METGRDNVLFQIKEEIEELKARLSLLEERLSNISMEEDAVLEEESVQEERIQSEEPVQTEEVVQVPDLDIAMGTAIDISFDDYIEMPDYGESITADFDSFATPEQTVEFIATAEPTTEPTADFSTEPEAETFAKAEAEPEAETFAKAEAEPEAEPEAENFARPEAEAEPELVSEPEPMPEYSVFGEPEPIKAEPQKTEPQKTKVVKTISNGKSRAWEVDMPGSPVKNIISAISLNDRVLFINTLFGEDPMLFQATITDFNAMESLEQAKDYISEKFPSWNQDAEVVYRLMMAVRRKLQ